MGMQPLLFLARSFIRTFGITEPTPKAERQAAIFIGVLMLGIVLVLVAFAGVLHGVMR